MNTSQLVSLPSASNNVEFTEWIFPNTIRFLCSGKVFGWKFRGVSANLSTIERLPRWTVYHETPATPGNNLDFAVRERSGNRNELVEIDPPGVYQYSLNSPVDVMSGDIVGVSYDNVPTGNNQLQLSFLDMANFSTSYRRPFSGAIIGLFDANGPAVTSDHRYIPLVIPIMGRY